MTRHIWNLRFLLRYYGKQRKGFRKSRLEDPETRALVYETTPKLESNLKCRYESTATSVPYSFSQYSVKIVYTCCFTCCRNIFRKRKLILSIVIASLVATAVIILGLNWLFPTPKEIHLKHCSIPDINPMSPEVRPLIQYSDPPKCLYEQRSHFEETPFTIQNGVVLVKNPNIDPAHFDSCCYRPFTRDGDSKVKSADFCKGLIENHPETLIPEGHEYIEVLCVNSDIDFRDGFPLIQTKAEVEARVREFSYFKPSQLNVIILGLDTASQMNFLRAMPKANKFLTQNLSAILLKGYTKAGENSLTSALPSVIPLLTGKSLQQFKLDCLKKYQEAEHARLDNCSIIWKVFADNGFRTAFSEDGANTGSFNMYWPNAFARPPTDYYLRPYSILMHEKHSNRNGYCHGATLSFEKLLENIKYMADAFSEEPPYFHFAYSSKLSHDDFNNLRWGDEPLTRLLEYFHANKYFTNTVMLIFGGHGSRLSGIQSSVQGQIEDRMPIAYMVLPDWFKTKYNKSYENLKRNANQITSAFDLYKTLLAFINLDRLVEPESDRIRLPNGDKISLSKFPGTSLFHTFPANRSCSSAGIPLHSCICHEKIPKDIYSEEVRKAAEFVIASINELLKGQNSCATLVLETVDQVLKLDSSDISEEICSRSFTIRKGNFSSEAYQHENSKGKPCSGEIMQISLTVSPSGATFETTVIQKVSKEWHLMGEIVRTNSYQGDSECVEQEFKPFCYCVEGIDENY